MTLLNGWTGEHNTGIEIMNRFHVAIDELIELNKLNRKVNSINKNVLNYTHYLAEFCTVRVDVGRRIGKTEYVKDNYYPYTDILIVNNFNQKRYYPMDFVVYTIDEVVEGFVRKSHLKPENVWIDDAFLTEEELKIVYNLFEDKNIEQTFIILGK